MVALKPAFAIYTRDMHKRFASEQEALQAQSSKRMLATGGHLQVLSQMKRVWAWAQRLLVRSFLAPLSCRSRGEAQHQPSRPAWRARSFIFPNRGDKCFEISRRFANTNALPRYTLVSIESLWLLKMAVRLSSTLKQITLRLASTIIQDHAYFHSSR